MCPRHLPLNLHMQNSARLSSDSISAFTLRPVLLHEYIYHMALISVEQASSYCIAVDSPRHEHRIVQCMVRPDT